MVAGETVAMRLCIKKTPDVMTNLPQALPIIAGFMFSSTAIRLFLCALSLFDAVMIFYCRPPFACPLHGQYPLGKNVKSSRSSSSSHPDAMLISAVISRTITGRTDQTGYRPSGPDQR